MLLRSSSTPILGSLLSPIQEGTNSNHETNTTLKHHLPPPSPTTNVHHSHSYNKLSRVAYIPTVSCKSSPRSPSVAADHKKIRRAQSEGNLQGLASNACKDEEDFWNAYQPSSNKNVLGRNKGLMLESIPSFSYSNLRGRREDDDCDWEDEDREEYLDEDELLQRNMRGGGERVVPMEAGEFSLSNEMADMVLSEEVNVKETFWNVGVEGKGRMVGQEIFLAMGLGIGGRGGSRGGKGGGGGGKFNSAGSGGDGGDSQGVEEYYKKMVEENPENPLFLSNYAQFLYLVSHVPFLRFSVNFNMFPAFSCIIMEIRNQSINHLTGNNSLR